MENGFEDWNLRGKFQFQDGEWCKYHSSSFLFGSFRANTLKHVHEATDFAKSHFKKEKSSHVILSGRFLIPEWVSIRVYMGSKPNFDLDWNLDSVEIRIELDPERVVTHSGLMYKHLIGFVLKWNEFIPDRKSIQIHVNSTLYACILQA